MKLVLIMWHNLREFSRNCAYVCTRTRGGLVFVEIGRNLRPRYGTTLGSIYYRGFLL